MAFPAVDVVEKVHGRLFSQSVGRSIILDTGPPRPLPKTHKRCVAPTKKCGVSECKEIAMSVIRVGTNQQYASGWDAVFGKEAKKGAKKGAAKPAALKKTAAKKATGKKAKRK